MRRAGKGYAIENNIRNKNPQWMVVEPKQPLFNDKESLTTIIQTYHE